MKKSKTINKLLSSLILLSPLSGVGFNNQYEKQKATVIKNNTTNNYANLNAQQVQMGDITVTVNGTTITEYYSGEGTLLVSSNITSIGDSAFSSRESIHSLDLSQATSLTTIEDSAFTETTLLSEKLTIPSSVITIGSDAFNGSGITELDLSNAKHLQNLYDNAFKHTKIKDFISTPETNQNFSLVTNLGSNAKVLISGNSGIWNENSKPVGALAFGKIVVPTNFKNIKNFQGTYISSLDLSQHKQQI